MINKYVLSAGCLGLEPRSNGFGIRHVAVTPTTHYSLVGAVGIEPTTYRLRGDYSAVELSTHDLAGEEGFEPTTAGFGDQNSAN